MSGKDVVPVEELEELTDSSDSGEDFIIPGQVETNDQDSEDDGEEKVIDEAEKKPVIIMASTQPKPRRKRFIPNYEIDGVIKLVIGEDTQIQIGMVIGADVNAQFPWKFVSKNKILEIIETSNELTEFSAIREQLESYEDDEIYMGYIVDESKDVDEFYVCYTKEARDHCKQQSEKFIRRQEKKLEKAVQKKPRPWETLGSEAEIFELIPENKRALFELEIKTKFPKVYEPKKFQIRDANSARDGLIELTPYRQKFHNVYRRRIDCASQVAPAKLQRFAQTDLRYPRNMWTQSIADTLANFQDTEGGGDNLGGQKLDADNDSVEEDTSSDGGSHKMPVDEVGLATYRAALKRARRPSYIKMLNKFLFDSNSEIDNIVVLNTVMDIYKNDYIKLQQVEKTVNLFESMFFEEYVCFTDVRAINKFVSSAVFHPMWTGILAISYADDSPCILESTSNRTDVIQRAVYGLNPVMIWSHIDSLIPKLYLESSTEVKVLSFCPFDENILIGGCINGQIVIWDLTNKLEHVETIKILSETREKYRIAMNAHMEWMKNVHDDAVVPITAVSNLITSHNGPVTGIKWLSPNFTVTSVGKICKTSDSKKSLIIFTSSEDGTLLIWNLSTENVFNIDNKKVKKSKRVPKKPSGLMVDVSPFKVLDRNLQPCYKLIIGSAGQPQIMPIQSFSMDQPSLKYTYTPRNKNTGRKYFCCEIVSENENDFSKTIYSGSQHGELKSITWEGHEFNTGEVIISEYCQVKCNCRLHDGVITSTLKNPFINEIVLTIGGKIFAIWSEKLLDRPLIWKKRPYLLTDGAWSLYKPSILFITTADGNLETWDLLVKTNKPIAIQPLSGNMLTNISLHTLNIPKNIIGVGDSMGSFKLFLKPPIFMEENDSYIESMKAMLKRELNVLLSYLTWQENWMRNNPHILLEIKRKEAALIAEKEEKKRKLKEEEEKRLEEEAERQRLLKEKVIGPEERWQMIIQKLIERTIAVKKRINRAELIEQEKPLRELEAQRLEKERRMLEIMKNQQKIFNDTVAILFPEAIKKQEKIKQSLLSDNIIALKKDYLEDYEYIKQSAWKSVREHPHKVEFNWETTLADGKERKQALNASEQHLRRHRNRLETNPEIKYQSPEKVTAVKEITDDLTEKMEQEEVS